MGLFKRFRNESRNREPPKLTQMRGVLRQRADFTLSGSEAIYAAVSRIANTIAELPIHLYRGQELQADHPLERLIAYAPSPCMTAFTFRQTMESNRNAEGNAYALIVPDLDGRPAQLDVLDPAHVVPMRDAETRELWYQWLMADGRPMTVHHSSMIVLRHMSANGEKGVRPIDVLRGTLGYDAKIKEFSSRQLEGVNSGVVLNVPGVGLNPEKKREVIRQFLDAYQDSGGSVVILEGGITATTLTQSPVDAQVLDVERITRNRVATVFNIPPHMLGDYSDTSYATAEQSMLEFLQMTINPIVEQWQDELNRKLLTWEMMRDGYGFRFNLANLWRTDMKTMAERAQMGIRSGWLTPNDQRRQDGLPTMAEGDTLMVSRDLVPLREAVKGSVNV